MWVHPQFDPVALRLGPLAIHWYGLTYLAAFGLFLWLANLRVRQPQFASRGWTSRDVDDVLFFGVLGVTVALALFARLRQRSFLELTDLVAPCVPTGLACGRIGNFINGELWGRAADPSLPWAMVFPQSGTLTPRHPSQIYQFLGEGLLLFVLLWLYARKPRATGQVSGAFLIGYGLLRFAAEFFREPDDFLGLRAFNLSQGQWLSIPMVLAGVLVWLWAGRRSAAQA